MNVGLPPSLDTSTVSQLLSTLAEGVYQGLLTYRGETIRDVEVAPSLAASWEYSDDLTLVLNLDERARWQNVSPLDGRPFVADDVVFGVQYFNDTPLAGGWAVVEGVEALDDHTAVLKMARPFAPFISSVITGSGSQAALMYPRELIEGPGLEQNAIGTGPFMLKNYDAGSMAEAERNPDYWRLGAEGEVLPYLDGYQNFTVGDYAARVARLKAGQIDQNYDVGGVTVTDARDLEEAGLNVRETRGAHARVLWLNQMNPIFHDDRVRHALNLLMDRQQQIELAMDGAGYISSFISVEGWGWANDTVLEKFGPDSRDVEEAVRLLTAAGHEPSELNFKFIGYAAATIGVDPNMMQVISQNLAEAGIQTTQEIVPDYATVLANHATPGDFDIYAQHAGTGPDPDPHLRTRYPSTNPNTSNWARINDPVLDELINEQAAILDSEERHAKIVEIEEYMYEKMWAPPIPQAFEFKVQQPWVRGRTFHFSGRPVGIEDLWLDR
jgi:peptide/nickel transport system substrate-binding protein